jgi:hypothetical protein
MVDEEYDAIKGMVFKIKGHLQDAINKNQDEAAAKWAHTYNEFMKAVSMESKLDTFFQAWRR